MHDNAGVKSVSNERTFATDVRTPAEVDGALSGLASKVTQRLRRKGLAGRTVNVKLRFSDFTTKTVRRTLPAPIDDERDVLAISRELVQLGVVAGYRTAAAWVWASRASTTRPSSSTCSPAPTSQATSAETVAARDDLVRGIDAVRAKFGDDAVKFGREVKPSPADTGTPPGTIPLGELNDE